MHGFLSTSSATYVSKITKVITNQAHPDSGAHVDPTLELSV